MSWLASTARKKKPRLERAYRGPGGRSYRGHVGLKKDEDESDDKDEVRMADRERRKPQGQKLVGQRRDAGYYGKENKPVVPCAGGKASRQIMTVLSTSIISTSFIWILYDLMFQCGILCSTGSLYAWKMVLRNDSLAIGIIALR